MSFMWAIPLFISTMVGRGLERRGAGPYKSAIGAGFIGFVIFLASEVILTMIPLWQHAEGSCTIIGNVLFMSCFLSFAWL